MKSSANLEIVRVSIPKGQLGEGAPADETHYKANVDVLLVIDAVEFSTAMVPDVDVHDWRHRFRRARAANPPPRDRGGSRFAR